LATARVPPTVVTLAGLVLAWAVVPIADAGSRWPLVAALVVVASGLADSLDGTVAVLSGRVSRGGALLDAVCDRVADAAYGVALWAVGAPAWLCLGWVGLSFLAEYVRARGQALLGSVVDIVTVGERPTRVVVAALFLAAAGLLVDHEDDVVTVGAAAGAGAAVVGLVRLGVGLRRRLR
jgi:phosphatidylglycerophosphate synthase